jgi:hypothetical protein
VTARYLLALFGWAAFFAYVLTQSGCATVAEHLPEPPKTPGQVAAKARTVADLSCVAYRACRDMDQCPDEAEANEACAEARPLDAGDLE